MPFKPEISLENQKEDLRTYTYRKSEKYISIVFENKNSLLSQSPMFKIKSNVRNKDKSSSFISCMLPLARSEPNRRDVISDICGMKSAVI